MDFRRSLLLSAFFHVCVLLAGFIVFPSIAPHETEAIASIPVDLISEAAQIAGEKDAQKMEDLLRRSVPTPAVRPDEVKPQDKPKPVDPSSAQVPPPPSVTAPAEQEKPAPPEKAQAKPEEVDPQGLMRKIEEAKKEDEKKKQEEKKREEAKKREEEKKKLAEEKKKAEEKRLTRQAEKFDATRISNLLNKQEGAATPTGKQAEPQKQASLGNPKGEGKSLTQNQHALMNDMIAKQVEPCYSPPLTAQRSDLIVSLTIMMNPDGSLNGRPQITNNNADPSFRAVSDAAVRAIMRCSPLKLPAEWYDIEDGWKKLDYDFKYHP